MVLLSILLRIIWIDSDSWFPNPSYPNPLSLDFEEKASAIPARNWVLFGEMDSYGGMYQPQGMMPLGFLLHAAWFRVFGVSLLQTRLPFVLIGALTFLLMVYLARRQLGPAALAAFVGLAGFNQTVLAYQRSCLDENLLLCALVLAVACRPRAPEGGRACALWGLLAFLPLATKPTGLVFAVAPLLALCIDLWPERRGTARKAILGLTAGAGAAAAAALALYAVLGGLRQNPFTTWLGHYNRALGHVPPLAGFTAYLHSFEMHLPVPEAATRPLLVLALAAPLLLRRTTFLTRTVFWALLLGLVAGAPVYFYYKRIVPLVPLVFYLAAAAGQGVLERLGVAFSALRSAAAANRRAVLSAAAALVWGAAVAGWFCWVFDATADGARATAAYLIARGPVDGYRTQAMMISRTVPPDAVLAAPDTFRIIVFDTPFRYRFTHDMAAIHVEGLTLEEALLRDACAVSADVLVEAKEDRSEPALNHFRARPFDPAGCGVRGAIGGRGPQATRPAR
jgi:hypothetical protein